MRKLLVGLAVFALATAVATPSQATSWGIGGFGGINIPLVQDDASNGAVYGGHLHLSMGMIMLEPHFMFFSNGDWESDDVPDETFEGSSLYKIGVNLILGGGPRAGFRPYLVGGVGYFNEDNDFRDFSDSQMGWNAGAGFEIGGGPLAFDIRGSFELMPLDGDGSRKWAHIRGGLNYYFGVM